VLTLSTVTPAKSGYNFKGWDTSSSATTAVYQPGYDKFNIDANTTLYAVWQVKPTYTVSYNANANGDAVTGMPSPLSQTKYQGEDLTLSSAHPQRNGYYFGGWATYSNAGTAQYLPEDPYKIDSSVTLYAVWASITQTYSIIYYANGGSGGPSTQTMNVGQSMPLSTQQPSWTGHSFLGWSTDHAATVPEFFPGQNYTGYTQISLYAVWGADNTSFDTAVTLAVGSTLSGATANAGEKRYYILASVTTIPGVNVTGLIRSYNPKNATTVQLLQNGAMKYEYIIPAVPTGVGQIDQPFTFGNVADGTYTLVITKQMHTKYTVQNIVVKGQDVDLTKDSRDQVKLIELLCGDLDHDGFIGPQDLAILLSSNNYMKTTPNALNPEADLNGDGTIGPQDLTVMLSSKNYMQHEVVVQ